MGVRLRFHCYTTIYCIGFGVVVLHVVDISVHNLQVAVRWLSFQVLNRLLNISGCDLICVHCR